MDVRRRNNVVVTGRADGPVLLLAHGFGCDQSMWRLLVPALSDQFRIVLFDYTGCGASALGAWDAERYASLDGYAADVTEICEELDLRDVTFVGHSVSAMVGVLAAQREPGRIGSLVLLVPNPRYIDVPEEDYRGGFSGADIEELLDSLEANADWPQWLAPVVMGAPERPDLTAELEAVFCATDPEVARVFARTAFLTDSRADLSGVAVPSLVVRTARDAIAPLSVSELVHREISGSRLVTLDATGHCPQLTAPEATARAVREFAGTVARQ
ncbi:alpha/beta fold hydrolase [Streptomyces bohaiensis]|uniref:Alpha/beta hydrolase n=1 Tax=Streptomyces bohaiensis TaxID=1431344 RepID=A0ABX1CBT8_9ACTN|nr:alpha/beta hydrolase [Streptomyces bohaiensis]NJQ15603.1 alpha/beta hydrolase [Streptomyces bohaiensis]